MNESSEINTNRRIENIPVIIIKKIYILKIIIYIFKNNK